MDNTNISKIFIIIGGLICFLPIGEASPCGEAIENETGHFVSMPQQSNFIADKILSAVSLHPANRSKNVRFLNEIEHKDLSDVVKKSIEEVDIAYEYGGEDGFNSIGYEIISIYHKETKEIVGYLKLSRIRPTDDDQIDHMVVSRFSLDGKEFKKEAREEWMIDQKSGKLIKDATPPIETIIPFNFPLKDFMENGVAHIELPKSLKQRLHEFSEQLKNRLITAGVTELRQIDRDWVRTEIGHKASREILELLRAALPSLDINLTSILRSARPAYKWHLDGTLPDREPLVKFKNGNLKRFSINVSLAFPFGASASTLIQPIGHANSRTGFEGPKDVAVAFLRELTLHATPLNTGLDRALLVFEYVVTYR